MEEFRRFNEVYEVSNLGSVKKNGKPYSPCHGKKYDFVSYKGRVLRVHEMVGQLFPEICGENDGHLHLHHVNGDSRDNRAENLVRLSKEDHKRLHQQENDVSVPVMAYDKYGNYVGRWDSKTQAAKATGVDYRHISEMVSGQPGRYSAGGYVWFKEDATADEIAEKLEPVMRRAKKKQEKAEQVEVKETLRRAAADKRIQQLEAHKNKKKVVEFDEFGNQVREWDSPEQAAEHYGLTPAAILNNIYGRTEFVKRGGSRKCFLYKRYIPEQKKK